MARIGTPFQDQKNHGMSVPDHVTGTALSGSYRNAVTCGAVNIQAATTSRPQLPVFSEWQTASWSINTDAKQYSVRTSGSGTASKFWNTFPT